MESDEAVCYKSSMMYLCCTVVQAIIGSKIMSIFKSLPFQVNKFNPMGDVLGSGMGESVL